MGSAVHCLTSSNSVGELCGRSGLPPDQTRDTGGPPRPSPRTGPGPLLLGVQHGDSVHTSREQGPRDARRLGDESVRKEPTRTETWWGDVVLGACHIQFRFPGHRSNKNAGDFRLWRRLGSAFSERATSALCIVHHFPDSLQN